VDLDRNKTRWLLAGALVATPAAFRTFGLGQYFSLAWFEAQQAGVLLPGLPISFTVLGLFPLLAKKIVEQVELGEVHARWKKPAHFDRNLVVIGGGSAGLVSSYLVRAVKAKITPIEKHKPGGDRLKTGCVPPVADPLRQTVVPHAPRPRIRDPQDRGQFRLRRRHGAGAARHQDLGTPPRLRRALPGTARRPRRSGVPNGAQACVKPPTRQRRRLPPGP
jgi:hypothetical protein